MDLALNNLQRLICHKTHTTNQPTEYLVFHICMRTQTDAHTPIGQMFRVFANGPGDSDSIPGGVIPKTQKMVFDTSLLNTQHFKVWIKISGAIHLKELHPLLYPGIVAIEKEGQLYMLYSHNNDQLYKHIIHIHLYMHAESTTHNVKDDERHSS